MEDRNVRRGDIYHADLDPVFGSEQGGYRPVLVIQNNIGNKYSPTVIVAAITSKEKMKLPTHIAIPEIEGLEKDSVVLLEQLRTLDKRRLENYVCTFINVNIKMYIFDHLRMYIFAILPLDRYIFLSDKIFL